MLRIGLHLSDEATKDIGGMWGKDSVHRSPEAYGVITRAIEDNTLSTDAWYTNLPNWSVEPPSKRLRVDLAKSRQEWVEGCSTTLLRPDTVSAGWAGCCKLRRGAGAWPQMRQARLSLLPLEEVWKKQGMP
jgi:hypothetical protein